MQQYLLPLKDTGLFPEHELGKLIDTTHAILMFQRVFSCELHEASEMLAQPNCGQSHIRVSDIEVKWM
jgi:hypothetical protein